MFMFHVKTVAGACGRAEKDDGGEEDRWPGRAAASSLEFMGERGETRKCLQKAFVSLPEARRV